MKSPAAAIRTGLDRRSGKGNIPPRGIILQGSIGSLTPDEEFYFTQAGFLDGSADIAPQLVADWLRECAEWKRRRIVRRWPSWYRVAARLEGRL